MSRESKFRAWFERENKMVLPENLALSYDGNDGFDFAFDKEFPDVEGTIPGTLCFNLMQYTGMKDKNGKEIFESDIIKVAQDELYEVRFDCGGFMAGDMFLDDYWNPSYGHLVEIVGNKFENPGLLEETIEPLEDKH
ncbi:YopX family protein [Neobacillus niacini]|uniref:YopX family protein n=1 Tax=Neobacillus niacini TaxID=86668 RepID=UPI0021CB31CD|nr:YopX family protein [Neobacillus niacini]MCM3763478.1 YopX family protein [Neobacillus niacini]